MNKKPRQYALVRLTAFMKKWLQENGHADSPLLTEDVFVFHGEIPNMAEHCIVSGYTNARILSAYDISNFVELDKGVISKTQSLKRGR